MSTAHADTSQPRHRLKLPQSISALIRPQDKSAFSVTQPLLLSPVVQSENTALVSARDKPVVGTVLKGEHQGFYPVSTSNSEGLNFSGMARQIPDLTRNFTNDTAGLMSWTTKFN